MKSYRSNCSSSKQWDEASFLRELKEIRAFFPTFEKERLYTPNAIALFIAKAKGVVDTRKEVQAILAVIIKLQAQLIKKYPDMHCSGMRGETLEADSLDLSVNPPLPSIYGWRWMEVLKEYPG